MSEDLDRFVAAGPPALRLGLRALLAVARRPRGSRLLERTPRLHTPALAALSLERYDDPVVSRALGPPRLSAPTGRPRWSRTAAPQAVKPRSSSSRTVAYPARRI